VDGKLFSTIVTYWKAPHWSHAKKNNKPADHKARKRYEIVLADGREITTSKLTAALIWAETDGKKAAKLASIEQAGQI
jgi:hypothetical protein